MAFICTYAHTHARTHAHTHTAPAETEIIALNKGVAKQAGKRERGATCCRMYVDETVRVGCRAIGFLTSA